MTQIIKQFFIYLVIIGAFVSLSISAYQNTKLDQKNSHLMKELKQTDVKLKNAQKKIKNQKQIIKNLKQKNLKINKTKSIINVIQELQPRLDKDLSRKIAKYTIKNCKKYGLHPYLVISIISRESSFNHMAVSSAECVGLMQINPNSHEKLFEKMNLSYHDLFDINTNIKLGCKIFKRYYKKHDGKLKQTLTNYVGGQHKNYVNDIIISYANLVSNEKEK